MFISPAYATAAGDAAGGGFDIVSLFPLVMIIIIFYFLLIRPQQKQMKEHRSMVEAVRRGDTIVTQGGIIGKVTKSQDNVLTVEIADGVRVKVVKSTITDVRSKSEPANEA